MGQFQCNVVLTIARMHETPEEEKLTLHIKKKHAMEVFPIFN